MSDELPTNWIEVKLEQICLPVSQRGPSSGKETFQYIDLGALDNKTKRIVAARSVHVSDAPSRAKQVVSNGDVLFSTVRVYLENIALVPEALDKEIASTAFCVLRPAHGIEPRFLYYFVTARWFVLAVNELQRGNSPPSVQEGDIRRQPFPLAPTREQGRIASRIDELFSRIEEGDRALERVRKLAKLYQRSVLKAAVTGELTLKWREKRKGDWESGKALLTRVLRSRREAWENAEIRKMEGRGVRSAKDNWKQKYQDPTPPQTTDLPGLPKGWVWASLDQLTSKITSGSRDWKDYYGRGNSVFVMAQNVRPRRLDLSEIQLVDPPIADRDAERSEIFQHDLLITIVGANTGHVCEVREALVRHYVCQSVALARPVIDLLSPFLELFLSADEGGQAQFAEEIYGAGRPHLSFDQLRAVCVPLPPLDEQRAICEMMSVIESDVDSLLRAINGSSLSVEAMRQSVLRSAFSGRLVPQDTADERVSTLFERIAAERNHASAAPRRSPKKKQRAE